MTFTSTPTTIGDPGLEVTLEAVDPESVRLTLRIHVLLFRGEAVDSTSLQFPREVLHDALAYPHTRCCGGDVRMEYRLATDQVCVEFSDPGGEPHPILIDAEPVRDFLTPTNWSREA